MSANNIEEALRAFLAAGTAVDALVDGRIYPVIGPDKPVTPYIVYRRMGTDRMGSSTDRGPAKATFRITCWSATYDQALALAKAVRERLANESSSWDGLTIQHSLFRGEQDAFDDSVELIEHRFLGRELDFEIMAAT